MKIIFTRFLFFFGIIIYLALLGNRSGAPAGRTGAPGETTCGTTNCHNTNPNLGSATINFTLNENQTTYQVGETNSIAISIDNAQEAGRNGFEIVALDAANNNIGEWIISGGNLRERTGGGRTYVTHTTDGSAQNAWEFEWVAPDEDAGPITFYLAVNDANNNGGRTGDDIYLDTLSVEAAIVSSVKEISSLTASTIYPNPVNRWLNLTIDLTETTELKGTIHNIFGQNLGQLFQENIPAGNSLKSYGLPQNLTQGQYYLAITNNNGGVKTIPFIKI